MTRQEIENLGQAMLTEHGLHDWCVLGVYEEDDTGCGDEDDIGSAYGRTFFEEKLIWVDMKCADDSAFVREILLHEIAHALIGEREGCARRCVRTIGTGARRSCSARPTGGRSARREISGQGPRDRGQEICPSAETKTVYNINPRMK
jgi:hypothetical protein